MKRSSNGRTLGEMGKFLNPVASPDCPLRRLMPPWQTPFMDINNRLFVEIHPFEGSNAPHPDPIRDAHFDPAYVYKVLGMYNPSETSECYFVLSNPARQIWFIPQRHLLAYKLIDSDEFFLPMETEDAQPAYRWRDGSRHPGTTPPRNGSIGNGSNGSPNSLPGQRG